MPRGTAARFGVNLVGKQRGFAQGGPDTKEWGAVRATASHTASQRAQSQSTCRVSSPRGCLLACVTLSTQARLGRGNGAQIHI
jgi:hypothetical protein